MESQNYDNWGQQDWEESSSFRQNDDEDESDDFDAEKDFEFDGRKISFVLDRENWLWISADDVAAALLSCTGQQQQQQPQVDEERLDSGMTITEATHYLDAADTLYYIGEQDKRTYSAIEGKFTNIGSEASLKSDAAFLSRNGVFEMMFNLGAHKEFSKWLWNDFLAAVEKFKERSMKDENRKKLESLKNANRRLGEENHFKNDIVAIQKQKLWTAKQERSTLLGTIQTQNTANSELVECIQKMKESCEPNLRSMDLGFRYFLLLIDKLTMSKNCPQPDPQEFVVMKLNDPESQFTYASYVGPVRYRPNESPKMKILNKHRHAELLTRIAIEPAANLVVNWDRLFTLHNVLQKMKWNLGRKLEFSDKYFTIKDPEYSEQLLLNDIQHLLTS